MFFVTLRVMKNRNEDMNVAVLLAGGSGKRMGGTLPKQFLEIAGRTILEHSIRAFHQNEGIDEIVIVSHSDFISQVEEIAKPYPKVKHVVAGGKERYDSTLNAIKCYGDACGNREKQAINLLIHDAVRPLVSQRIISDCIAALERYNAVDVAIPSTDTIVEVNDGGHICRIPQRATLRNVQTPQCFRLETIAKAYEIGLKDPGFVTTDDAGVVHRYLPEEPIYVVEGDSTNIKVTYPSDLILANKVLSDSKEENGVSIEINKFASSGKASEIYAFLHVKPEPGESFDAVAEKINKAKAELKSSLGEGATIVFERYFLSDIANQYESIESYHDGIAATSLIKQEPLDGSKVALLVYFQIGTEVTRIGNTTKTFHNGYTHLWTTNLQEKDGDSYLQTHKLLADYEQSLKEQGASIANNCLRTWFFVRDVDSNYAGLVKGRREFFTHIGLTPETHYIASTGIDGSPMVGSAKVQLEAISTKGIADEQVVHLKALTHLNPTYEYGVTFERGTSVQYGDRKHLWISGTASINNKGEILHEKDVTKQTKRMWENVEALLKEGDATFDDVMYMIVYLRDIADYATVEALYKERFPNKPKVFVHAPVCRPGWLIEMECEAIVAKEDSRYADF